MELPKRLGNPPVKEAVIEIRFESEIPEEAVFGIVWSRLNKLFDNTEECPILQIPKNLRDADPNLKFVPQYKFTCENSTCQLNPRAVGISMNKYSDWSDFYNEAMKVVEAVHDVLFKKIIRMGVRYINLFDFDIFSSDKLLLNVKIGAHEDCSENIITRAVFCQDDIKTTVICQNNANVLLKDKPKFTGSILDIDSFFETEFFPENHKKIGEKLISIHKVLKKEFFTILSEDYIKQLQPE